MTGDSRSVLLLHGWQNRRPPGHWQRWLAGELEATGAQVLYPQLPDPDEPDLDAWLVEVRRHARSMTGAETVVVAHSLAVLLWWTAALSDEPVEADRVLLVAPPAPDVLRREVVAPFVPEDVEHRPVDPRLLATVRVVAGDEDPYCPEGARRTWVEPHGLRPDRDLDVVPGGGHLDLVAGYGAWPSVLAWCQDPSTRLVGRGGDGGPGTAGPRED